MSCGIAHYYHRPVADPGEGPWGPAPPPPLSLDQTEARKAEIFSLDTALLISGSG